MPSLVARPALLAAVASPFLRRTSRAFSASPPASTPPSVEALARAGRVVVARDHVVDLVRVAVRVHDPDDRDLQLARLLHRDRLLARIDHEDGVGHVLHALDALQVLLDLAPLLL